MPSAAGEGVVLLLGAGARLDHIPRVGVERICAVCAVIVTVDLIGRAERHAEILGSVGFRVQLRVEDELHLRVDLGQHVPADRVGAVAEPPDRERPGLRRLRLGRRGSVRVQIQRDQLRELLQIFWRRRRRHIGDHSIGIRPLIGIGIGEDVAAGLAGEFGIRPQPISRSDPTSGLFDRTGRRQQPGDPDRPVQHRATQRRPPRGQPGTRGEFDISVQQIRGLHDPGSARRIDP
ncbi:hypothetical protein [Microbacterium aurantiacum]|uniref:hypothetical protein n=1 Tax=Microbacterium aurantiacum TaxID=162393 RepID=UPI000C80E33E|nr:hypothetical protein [Microbacterium aurantiacum]